jgi:uncharacterized membrane protein
VKPILAVDASSLPTPLAIASSSDLAFPYIVGLFGIIIAVAILLFVFSSLRKYRRKRNILVYVVTLLIIALLLFQIEDAPRRAVITYWYAGGTKYYGRTDNQVVMGCQNHGDRAASFYLVFSSVNASFQVTNQQNYIQASSRTVKVPFSLQESGVSMSTDTKPVFFTIDENVTEFSFSFSLEAQDYSHLVVSSGDTDVSFVWNVTENCYILTFGSGFS